MDFIEKEYKKLPDYRFWLAQIIFKRFFFYCFFGCLVFFLDKVSLFRPGCPGAQRFAPHCESEITVLTHVTSAPRHLCSAHQSLDWKVSWALVVAFVRTPSCEPQQVGISFVARAWASWQSCKCPSAFLFCFPIPLLKLWIIKFNLLLYQEDRDDKYRLSWHTVKTDLFTH